jgi:23S rRNA (guanosine2251-2'-O)-methyltransferase
LFEFLSNLNQAPFLLILDGVTDPHNLGACMRSAEAAGVQAVIIPKDNAVGITPTVQKVASGAAEIIPLVVVTNLSRTLRQLQDRGIWVIGAAGETEQLIYDADLKGPLAIVMGAEEKGLRRLTRDNCDILVKLPMMGLVSSLNVSVAAGVCLFEALRQRQAAVD